MRSLLDELVTNEAILLMYLADELPDGDRAAVETRLASDESLRADLARLRDAQETVACALRRLDASQPIQTGAASSSQRKLSRVIRQWQAERARQDALAEPALSRRARWWIYPVAAAAALAMGYTVWWGFQPQSSDVLVGPAEPQAPFRMAPAAEGGRGFFGPRIDPLQDFTTLADAEQLLDDLVELRSVMQ